MWRLLGLVHRYAVAASWRLWPIQTKVWAATTGTQLSMGRDVRVFWKTRVLGRGRVVLGDRTILGGMTSNAPGAELLLQARDPDSEILIGDGCALMNGVEIVARGRIELGKDCRIGARTVIVDSDFHHLDPAKRDEPDEPRPVKLGDRVWTGFGAIILKGVQIGDDAVIGAGAVVTKNVPAGMVAAGNPARVLGSVHGR